METRKFLLRVSQPGYPWRGGFTAGKILTHFTKAKLKSALAQRLLIHQESRRPTCSLEQCECCQDKLFTLSVEQKCKKSFCDKTTVKLGRLDVKRNLFITMFWWIMIVIETTEPPWARKQASSDSIGLRHQQQGKWPRIEIAQRRNLG